MPAVLCHTAAQVAAKARALERMCAVLPTVCTQTSNELSTFPIAQVVAKALALECMRAAKAQERGCYVFAFAGPQEVRGTVVGVTCCLVQVGGWELLLAWRLLPVRLFRARRSCASCS